MGSTDHLTQYPEAHHVVVPFRTVHPAGKAEVDEPARRVMQQVRTIVIDGKPLCLPMDGELRIEPMVGSAGHRVTVEFYADSVLFEPNPDL